MNIIKLRKLLKIKKKINLAHRQIEHTANQVKFASLTTRTFHPTAQKQREREKKIIACSAYIYPLSKRRSRCKIYIRASCIHNFRSVARVGGGERVRACVDAYLARSRTSPAAARARKNYIVLFYARARYNRCTVLSCKSIAGVVLTLLRAQARSLSSGDIYVYNTHAHTYIHVYFIGLSLKRVEIKLRGVPIAYTYIHRTYNTIVECTSGKLIYAAVINFQGSWRGIDIQMERQLISHYTPYTREYIDFCITLLEVW